MSLNRFIYTRKYIIWLTYIRYHKYIIVFLLIWLNLKLIDILKNKNYILNSKWEYCYHQMMGQSWRWSSTGSGGGRWAKRGWRTCARRGRTPIQAGVPRDSPAPACARHAGAHRAACCLQRRTVHVGPLRAATTSLAGFFVPSFSLFRSILLLLP
jgi:hypothetical protein